MLGCGGKITLSPCEVVAALELHGLLLLVEEFLMLLLLLGGGVGLQELARRWIFVPAPLFLEFFVDETDAPARFAVDSVEDGEDFFLLAAVGENFSRVGEGAQADGRNAAGRMLV